MGSDCIAHVALAAVTALAWLGLGSLVLLRVPDSGDRLLDVLNRLGLGALAFALLTFAAGWLGLLYAAAYIPVFAVTAAAGLLTARRLAREVSLPRVGRWPAWQRLL